MAQLGWIDFSKTYRQKVGTILDLLKPEGMVDELGIGTIRDAIADQLFPGISTIQTKAKYFFIIPYILYDYLYLDNRKRKTTPATKYLDDREHEIMWQLADLYDHKEGIGVIGISKYRPQRIMRRPSEIYWGGLNTYRIMDTGGLGVNSFLSLRNQSSFESLISKLKQGDDSAGDDADAEFENLFRIKIPPNPSWSLNLTLELTEEEADTLKNKILDVASDRLVGELLTNNKLKTDFRRIDDFMEFAKISVNKCIPDPNVRDDLIIAHDFSEFIYGAHIIYNYQIQKMRFKKTYWTEEWEEWFDELHDAMLGYDEFDPTLLFRPPFSQTTREYTQAFVREFWRFLKNNRREMDSYSELVINQEYNSKKYKARLKFGKLDDVKEEQWIGLKRLSYRYSNAKVILGDIYSQMDK